MLLLIACVSPVPDHASGHALWLRRRWLHEARTDEEIAALVDELHAHGITAIYPFVGPMRPGGRFGWRDGDALREYDPAVATAFFARMHGSGIRVLPWTGGVNGRDVHLDDATWRHDFVAQAAALVALGADGVQLNIEPMPAYAAGYLDLLRELRAAIGEHAIGVAAYPPPTPLHPYADVHWSLDFLAEVCDVADDVAVMAYDTSLPTAAAYSGLLTEWTEAIGRTLPAPGDPRGCTWRMGVPDYDDDEPWHRPAAETLEAAIAGIAAARPGRGPDGLAIYASWTTDAVEWAAFDRRWRGVEPAGPVIDP